METQGSAGPGGDSRALASGRARAKGAGRPREKDVIGRVWHFFTSVRLALVLILLLTAAVLAGTLLLQASASVRADPVAYELFLEGARGKYGLWADVFDFFQFFNIFHTLWFRLILGLLTINIIICSANRWKGIWTTAFRTRTRMGDAFFQHARYNAAMTSAMPVSAAAERVKRALSRSRYRVQTQADANSVAIYADRNRLSKFGTFLIHLSIVLILAGAVVGSVWGWSDPGFVVSEGATREVGMGTGLSVKLEHFADEYYLEGPPKDFRSEIVIYDDGVPVKSGTVRVNTPMSYNGIRFHQSFFGQTAIMEVTDAAGEVIFSEPVPLSWQTRPEGRPLGSFNLPEENLTVFVIGPISGLNDPLIPAGTMRVEMYQEDNGTLVEIESLDQGTPTELEGLNFTFLRESRFTGLRVVKDPGVNMIWIASTLMVVGLVVLFYFPHRRLWALCKSRPDGTAEVRLGMTSQRDMSLSGEFDKLRDKVKRALGIAPDSSDSAEGGEKDV